MKWHAIHHEMSVQMDHILPMTENVQRQIMRRLWYPTAPCFSRLDPMIFSMTSELTVYVSHTKNMDKEKRTSRSNTSCLFTWHFFISDDRVAHFFVSFTAVLIRQTLLWHERQWGTAGEATKRVCCNICSKSLPQARPRFQDQSVRKPGLFWWTVIIVHCIIFR